MNCFLKPIGFIISSDELCYSFSLQSVDDILIHRLKTSSEVATLKDNGFNLQTKFNITSSIKTPKPLLTPKLNINQSKVFESCDLNEKNFIMLSPNYFSDCTTRNIHNIKSEMSPRSDRGDYVVACLTSSGIIELFKYAVDGDELQKLNVDFCELRKSQINLPAKEITKFEMFRTAFNDVSFSNIEWCPLSFDNFKILMAVTNNDEIIFYRIQDSEVTQEFSKKIRGASANQLKWMDVNDQHFLLVSTVDGNLIRYSIALDDDGSLNEILKIDEIKGILKNPISNIKVDYYENVTILLCCKTHSIEVFSIKEDLTYNVFEKYIDLKITGIENCDNLEYFISTLNSKVYLIKLFLEDDQLTLDKFERIEINFAENDLQSSKFAFYGLAMSKNNVFVYLSCYPQASFDHLVVKQPAQISINRLSKTDPFKILLNNETLRLTEFADCVEAVRFIGLGKLEELGTIENLEYSIELSNEFLYYLKLQLLVVNIKLKYYQNRSPNIYEIISANKESIKEIISAINSYFILTKILKQGKFSNIQRECMRCLIILLKNYCESNIQKEPFCEANQKLRPDFIKLIHKYEKMIKDKRKFHPEKCSFCQEEFSEHQLQCSLNHFVKRCIVTNLLVPLDCNNHCSQCKECVTKLETLTLILGSSHHSLCPFCDVRFIFNE